LGLLAGCKKKPPAEDFYASGGQGLSPCTHFRFRRAGWRDCALRQDSIVNERQISGFRAAQF
jgi:hypothetical protein